MPARAQAAELKPWTADVPVRVRVHGSSFPKDEKFTFELVPKEGETLIPDPETLTITGAGTGYFELTDDEVGEHHYTLKQIPGSADYWTYDTREYDVTVYFMWSGRELYSEVIIKGDDGLKYEEGGFDNDYNPPVTPPDPDKPDPDNPDKPDPDNPDPDTPDKPDPDEPDKPDTPDEPDNPDQPKPETPDKPKTDNPDRPSGVLPQTGDQIALYVGGACVLGVAAVAAGVALKRRSDRQ